MFNSKLSKTKEVDVAVRYQDCFAKTYLHPITNQVVYGQSVLNHTLIVGEVAKELLGRMPSFLKKSIFPDGSALLAATHDIGKVSPTFYLKLANAVGVSKEIIPQWIKKWEGIDERSWGGHAGVSAITLRALTQSYGLSTVVGQHHGAMPDISGYHENSEVFGGLAWHSERIALVERLKSSLNEDFPVLELSQTSRVLALSGLATVSDWIGSGQWFEDPSVSWRDQVVRAVNEAGFIVPEYKRGLMFEDIFGFKPLPTQAALFANCTHRGVYILEAPMGLGKTEAAFYAAYKLLENNKANGIYFALPTQLTSNKIYERFNVFLTKILSSECQFSKALLLHSNAWLMEFEMGEDASPGNSWFSSAKRGLLFPFSVGTIDQALMSAMRVKHSFVRSFGLAGKVVILDEVHSYDAYTSVILDELIQILVGLQCTVIILSATLSVNRRQDLFAANLRNPMPQQNDYPLVSVFQTEDITKQGSQKIELYSVPPLQETHVSIAVKPMMESSAVEECLKRALEGQQVLWVENTVSDAQARYFDFSSRCYDLKIECGLLHSRFTHTDRESNEELWVDAYGKLGWGERGLTGRILIGTQVLEQSLDIDSDFLVSRIAPKDMLLQRLGRLWRHTQTPRHPNAVCEAWILAPDLKQALTLPFEEFGQTAMVYSPYVLCRTLLSLDEHLKGNNEFIFPRQIRDLIENTYSDVEAKGEWIRLKQALFYGEKRGAWERKGVFQLQQLARINLTEFGQVLTEEQAQTRYSEQDSSVIFVFKNILLNPEEKITKLVLLDDEVLVIPWQRYKLSKDKWKALSVKVMLQQVICPANIAPQKPRIKDCRELGLHHVLYLGNDEQESANFSLAFLSEVDELEGLNGMVLSNKYCYKYRNDIGLQIIRKEI